VTSDTYVSAYAQERKQWPQLTNSTRKKIKAAYTLAAKNIADIIREGSLVDGQLDWITQRRVDQAILEGSQAIGDAMREHIPALLTEAAAGYVAIETTFVSDAFRDLTSRVTKDGIEKMFAKVARETVQKALNLPLAADGQIFWSRVPNIAKQFGPDMVNFVRAGINEGRDLGQIAKDVTEYTAKGKIKSAARWGENLKPGSKRFLARCPESIDYRALRLARSELGRGLQETAKANGPNNPGGLGLYDWVRINAIDWHCNCPNNAMGSPYTLEETAEYHAYPPYDHPNDMCICRQRMKDGNDFRRELEAWTRGEPNADLDRWYRNSYLPGQF